MLKKAVKQKQLALVAQTLRTLTASDLGQVNGGQGLRHYVSGTSAGGEYPCSSNTHASN